MEHLTEFMGEKCFTTEEVRTFAGNDLSKQLFGQIRYTYRLLPPPPFKVGDFDGVITYYPQRVVIHWEKIIEAKKRGSSLRRISEDLAEETRSLFDECALLRNKFEAYKKAKFNYSKKMRRITSSNKTGSILKINVAEPISVADGVGVDVRDTVEKIVEELREDFKNCDFSTTSLLKVKQKIVKMEDAQNEEEAKKLVQAEWEKVK